MIHIGGSDYIPTGKLEKFNRTSNDFMYLKDFYSYLDQVMKNEGKVSKSARGKRWIKRLDIKEEIRVTAVLEPEIYHQLQTTLLKITGRLWPMDEFIHLMTYWFIYTYKDPEIEKEKVVLPLHRKHPDKRLTKITMFNNKFKKYYKNMMGSWNYNLKEE